MAGAPTDDLRTKVAVHDAELRSLRQLLEGLTATSRESVETVREVWQLTERLEGQARETARMRDDFREDLEGLERRFANQVTAAVDACSKLGDRLTKASDQRLVSRTTVTVALLGLAGTIAAAVLPQVL